MEKSDEKWSVFWCSLLHPIIFNEIEPSQINNFLKDLSRKEVVFPNGRKKRPSLSTLRRKLNQYLANGFEGLFRKSRNDKGIPRSASQEIFDKAIEIKCDQPKRSHQAINLFLQDYYQMTLSRSTLYRHLKQNGATRFKLGVVKKKVRCRWTRDIPNDLWVGDFSYGPYVLVDGEIQPTYLSLFIDCHSRYVVEGRYYLRQSLDIVVDTLLRAWSIHGISNDLYLDNGKVYHADALKSACYALHIRLLHRGVGDPSPGGLVERLFGTGQDQFESEVRAGDILTLDMLNRAFSAWLHTVYHVHIHSETNEKPIDRFNSGRKIMKSIDMEVARKFFMKDIQRTVHKDFSDVAVNNRFFKVDRKYRGDRVIVKYDPFSTMESVLIFSQKEEYLAKAPLYHREKRDQIETPMIQGKPKHNLIDLMIRNHEKQIEAKAQGMDYSKVLSPHHWPFASFIQKLAQLMGKKGGVSAFNADELESLTRIYEKHTHLNEYKLVQAFERAEVKNIPHVTLELQKQ